MFPSCLVPPDILLAILGARKAPKVAEIGDATEVAFLRLKLLKEAHKPDRKETFVVGFGREECAMSATILLVEDDPLLLTILRELLEFGGHSVVTCENGREAVQQLSMAQIDLVITDLSMPEMDGLELIKVLTFEWPDTRVIAMSGLLDSRARQLIDMGLMPC